MQTVFFFLLYAAAQHTGLQVTAEDETIPLTPTQSFYTTGLIEFILNHRLFYVHKDYVWILSPCHMFVATIEAAQTTPDVVFTDK